MKGLLILALLISVCFEVNAYAEEKIENNENSCGIGGSGHWFETLKGCPNEFSIRWDNDKFLRSNKDRYYTNGLKLDLKFLGKTFMEKESDGLFYKKNYALNAGQEIYTPTDITTTDVDRMDRPYAGWLYFGIYREEITSTEVYEKLGIKIGVLGHQSRADDTQTWVHHAIDVDLPVGWRTQIASEPGIQIYWERLRKFWQKSHNDVRLLDIAFPVYKLEGGNIFTHGSVGTIIRAGWLRPYHESGSIVSSYRDSEVGTEKRTFLFRIRELAVYFAGDFKTVIHNATMEGGGFEKWFNGNKNNAVIRPKNRFVLEGTVGIYIGWKKLSITANYNILSPEKKLESGIWEGALAGAYNHKYHGMEISYRF